LVADVTVAVVVVGGYLFINILCGALCDMLPIPFCLFPLHVCETQTDTSISRFAFHFSFALAALVEPFSDGVPMKAPDFGFNSVYNIGCFCLSKWVVPSLGLELFGSGDRL